MAKSFGADAIFNTKDKNLKEVRYKYLSLSYFNLVCAITLMNSKLKCSYIYVNGIFSAMSSTVLRTYKISKLS